MSGIWKQRAYFTFATLFVVSCFVVLNGTILYNSGAQDQEIIENNEEALIIEPAPIPEPPVVLEIPVVEDNVPVVVDPVVEDNAPVVVDPVVEDNVPVVVDPVVEDNAPVVVDPVVEDNAPVVVDPVVEDNVPVVVEDVAGNEIEDPEKDKNKKKKNPLTLSRTEFKKTEDCADESITSKQLIEANLNNEVYVCGRLFLEVADPLLGEVSNYTVTLYDSNSTAGTCLEDKNICYRNKAGVDTEITGCVENVCTFKTKFKNVAFFANPSASWKTDVAVSGDAAVAENDMSQSLLQVEELVAVDVSPIVDFSTMELGGISDETKITFQNTGNGMIDVEQSSSGDMICETGVIPADSVRYSYVSGFYYEEGLPFSVVAQQINLNLAKSDSEIVPAALDLYLRIKIPPSGVGGVCQNVLTFNAIADQ